MKLLWVLCLCLVGKLHAASLAEEAASQSNSGTGYMMAFPMNDEDQLAEESAESVVRTIADAIVNEEGAKDGQEVKEPVVILDIEDKKDDQEATAENVEPMGLLEAQMEEEEGSSKAPRRPLFKRPKIEELRKILGFPSSDASVAKPKVIPPEKPKAFQSMFKPKPKSEMPQNGFQISIPLRREDKPKPFGFPMLPLQRNEGIIRPFGFPDLVQAASSIIRRAIIDDIEAQDINKDADDDEEETNEEPEPNTDNNNNNNEEENDEEEEEEDDDEPLMIVPIPDGKDDPMLRPPLFRRFPLPLPFPVPRPMVQSQPRLPMPPIAPVALFLPLAQQIMKTIMSRSAPAPRSQAPPMLPVSPIHQFVPIQPPMQNLVPIFPIQPNFVPMHPPMVQPLHHLVPIHTPLVPQQTMQAPILIPLPQNIPAPFLRPMSRRMPMTQQQHPAMARRMPNPMARIPIATPHPSQFINPMASRQIPEAAVRQLQRLVRPPMPPMHPIFLMIPTNVPMLPQQQQQIPIFHRPPQQLPFIQQQIPVFHRQVPMPLPSNQDEERIVLVRADPEDQDDDQEVIVLVPSDEIEEAQTQKQPIFLPQQIIRAPPVATPMQRMRLLRELLMARQNHRQQAQMQTMASQSRPRIVEIVQQQLRIIPHHQRGQQGMPLRAEGSELHPVYVPYPGPQ